MTLIDICNASHARRLCALVLFGVIGCSDGNKERLEKKAKDKEIAELMKPSPTGATIEEVKAHTAKIREYSKRLEGENRKYFEGKTDEFSVSVRKENEKSDMEEKAREAKLKEDEEKEYSWKYEKNIDEMSGKESRFAYLKSRNSLHFNTPYDGGSSGSLMIRQRKIDGLVVLFSISKGQIICNSKCAISVRFDDRPLIKFSASVPADYSSTSIFIYPASKFVSELKKSKKILIEGNYYQAGSRISEFDNKNFEWN